MRVVIAEDHVPETAVVNLLGSGAPRVAAPPRLVRSF